MCSYGFSDSYMHVLCMYIQAKYMHICICTEMHILFICLYVYILFIYACIHLYMSVCAYVIPQSIYNHICTYMYVYSMLYVYACICLYYYMNLYMYVYVCIGIYALLYVCVCNCMCTIWKLHIYIIQHYTCIYMQIQAFTYIYMHIHAYINIYVWYMHIHTYTCLYAFQSISVWSGLWYRHFLRYRHIRANICIYVLIQANMNSPKNTCTYKYNIYWYVHIHTDIISAFTYEHLQARL